MRLAKRMPNGRSKENNAEMARPLQIKWPDLCKLRCLPERSAVPTSTLRRRRSSLVDSWPYTLAVHQMVPGPVTFGKASGHGSAEPHGPPSPEARTHDEWRDLPGK